MKKLFFSILFLLCYGNTMAQYDPQWFLFEAKVIQSLDSVQYDYSKADTVNVDVLDSLVQVKLWGKDYLITDTSQLNVYNFPYDSIPTYSDSVYEQRLQQLDMYTPIDLTFNKVVKRLIDVYAVKQRRHTSKILGLAHFYFPMIEQMLDKYDIPLEMKYLAVVESALNPKAGSRAGAKGLWQFMPGTGKIYGLKVNSLIDDRYDPLRSTEAACKHMRDLYDIYGNWSLVMAAYNSGAGNVNRAIRYAGGVKNYWAIWPYLPRETRGYVPAFIAVNYVMNYTAEHNLYPIDPGYLYQEVDTVRVNDVLSFEQVSEVFDLDMETIKFLNPRYKRSIIPANDNKKHYLRLPYHIATLFLEKEQEVYNYKTKEGIEREKILAEIKKAKSRRLHIVRSGENLGVIARRYRTSVRKLKKMNRLRNNRIYPGQKLVVFPGTPYEKSGGNGSGVVMNQTSNHDNSRTTHKVRNGETLGTIAKKYHVSVSNLKKWNNLRNNLIRVNQRLIVKQPTPKNDTFKSYTWHTVKSGDTVWDIAKKYSKTSVNMILKANGLKKRSRLKVGQKLKIPLKS